MIVSSGAVAAGLDPLGFASKPSDLASVQAAENAANTRPCSCGGYTRATTT